MPASGRSASLVAVAVSALTHSYARRSRWTVDGRQRIGEARSSSRNVDAWWLYALVQRPVCSVLVVPKLSHSSKFDAYDWSMARRLTPVTGSE